MEARSREAYVTVKLAHLTAASRPGTEDRLAVHHRAGGLVVVVADGAGGISGGGAAAERALAIVARALGQPGIEPFASATWTQVLAGADLEIEEDPTCGETTAVVIAVSAGGLAGASVGDSGAWGIHEDGHDDLTAGQHRKRRLGSGRALPVTFERPALRGTLLVATDGLLAYARPADMHRIAQEEDLEAAAQALVQLVRLPSGQFVDDVALVLLRFG